MAQQFESSRLKYTIAGFTIGILISIIIMLISISINNYTFSVSSAIQINRDNPINILLLISPIIVLSFFGYLAGTQFDKLKLKQKNKNIDNNNRFENVLKFIEQIRKGKTSSEKFSDDDNIILSLKNLNNEINKTKKEDKSRQNEDIQRHWTSEGLALFGAILREYNESITILANKVISELVKYTGSLQAGFFIIEETKEKEKVINEIANFAYDRKRLANKEIKWGEGLIGACIIEKKTTFLDSISESYVEIESGLGSAKPRSILIVPIMTEEGLIHGALELSSFKIFEKFEINFIEQIAESIATTISTLKINAETSRLLEESKKQASAMANQEDELRKTISNMRRLQENADIQSVEFRAYQNATNQSLIRAEFTIDGKLEFANKKFITLFEYKSNSEIQNENISKFINPREENWFKKVSNDIIENKHYEGLLRHISKTGKNLWIKSSYIGLRNDKGKVENILFLGIDTTDLILEIDSQRNKLSNIDKTLFKLELNINNEIININKNLLNRLNYKEENIINNKVSEFISKDDFAHFSINIGNVFNTGKHYTGEISFQSSENEKAWLYGSIIPETDLDGHIISLIIYAYDYSEEHNINKKIVLLEKQIEEQDLIIKTAKERLGKRIDQTKEEMKELYIEVETNNIFFEKTFKILPDAIITINNDNKIEFLNNKAIDILNVEDDDYKGKDIKTILPEIDKKFKGQYLGNILDYSNEILPIGKKEQVFILNKVKKQSYYLMTMTEAIVGLRKRLTVFLSQS